MPQKGGLSSGTASAAPPLPQWRFGALTVAAFLGMLSVWGFIDGQTIKTPPPWLPQNYVNLRLPKGTMTQIQNPPILNPNVSFQPSDLTQKEGLNSSHNVSHLPTNLTQKTLSLTHQLSYNPTHDLRWISADLEPNLTSNLLARWLEPGGVPCKDSRTVQIAIPGLDGRDLVTFPAGEIHEIVFHALDDSGNPRCSGGDYFETDISGPAWKSRPPVRDSGNGSYTLSVQVHPDFAGDYNLTIILLFRHFEGLKFSPERFAFDRPLRRVPIRFHPTNSKLSDLRACEKADFSRNVWAGRWTRMGKNDTCEIGNDGRYRCLSPGFPCRRPWCRGPLGSLESNGWVYSAHCSFRVFSGESAWNCLRNRWVFFWGDSNHVDTIRNLLNFVLGVPAVSSVPRRFDLNFTNPNDPTESVRITSIFNGHWNETSNYRGLDSLRDEGFRGTVKGYFAGATVPDTVIMNSGLHDGVFWPNIRRFAGGAGAAARFWGEVVESVRRRGVRPPEIVYRTTVATGGYARRLAFNPSKMEAFNWVVLEKLREAGLVSGVVDAFDLSYAWHFDNRCNDGVHYGRAPAKMRWRDGQIGHQYFVDLMLAHVLLNRLCSS